MAGNGRNVPVTGAELADAELDAEEDDFEAECEDDAEWEDDADAEPIPLGAFVVNEMTECRLAKLLSKGNVRVVLCVWPKTRVTRKSRANRAFNIVTVTGKCTTFGEVDSF
jgi:hypothetical protein